MDLTTTRVAIKWLLLGWVTVSVCREVKHIGKGQLSLPSLKGR